MDTVFSLSVNVVADTDDMAVTTSEVCAALEQNREVQDAVLDVIGHYLGRKVCIVECTHATTIPTKSAMLRDRNDIRGGDAAMTRVQLSVANMIRQQCLGHGLLNFREAFVGRRLPIAPNDYRALPLMFQHSLRVARPESIIQWPDALRDRRPQVFRLALTDGNCVIVSREGLQYCHFVTSFEFTGE